MMKVLMALLALLVVTSCGSKEALVVKQFTVKEIGWNRNDDELMVRGEVQKRLYGAISQQEQEDRKGQYYSVRWRASPSGEPVRVEFAYRQAVTGSQIKRLQHQLPAGRTGVVEFSVAGESYRVGGRVLAWRMRLFQGETLLSEKQSFLWE